MPKVIEISDVTVCCDQEGCGFTTPAPTMEDMKALVDQPCPNCGSILLTAEDFKKHEDMHHAVTALNNMSLEELSALFGAPVSLKDPTKGQQPRTGKFGLDPDGKMYLMD